MRRIAGIALSIVLVVIIFLGSSSNFNAEEKTDFPVLKGDYFGQKLPGMQPEIFAPGIISTEAIEFQLVFSPASDELHFTRFNSAFKPEVWMSRKTGEVWSKPSKASFSIKQTASSPFFSADGKKLYFMSDRLKTENAQAEKTMAIWVMEKKNDEWSEPTYVGFPKGYVTDFWIPRVAKDGYFYFGGKVKNSKYLDILRTKFKEGEFTSPENLGNAVNNPDSQDVEPVISPDGSYMIFYSAFRDDQIGNKKLGDLYISFRNKDGNWTKTKNMGPEVNSIAEENWPVISPDGRFIFFSSNRGQGNNFPDIYWVSSKVIDKLKPGK